MLVTKKVGYSASFPSARNTVVHFTEDFINKALLYVTPNEQPKGLNAMEKWQKKWMAQHPDASLQEFSVALSQHMTQTSVALMVGQIVFFIAVLLVAKAI